jgi:hypothetical protein
MFNVSVGQLVRSGESYGIVRSVWPGGEGCSAVDADFRPVVLIKGCGDQDLEPPTLNLCEARLADIAGEPVRDGYGLSGRIVAYERGRGGVSCGGPVEWYVLVQVYERLRWVYLSRGADGGLSVAIPG